MLYTKEDWIKYIQKLNEEYKEKHLKEQEYEDLIVQNNVEQRDIKGYHGREILELLQNADDAYQKSINQGKKPDYELEVCIKYVNNVLTISNSGAFFDEDGLKSIVQGNNSPKRGGFIGCKGTGFRSVLNWASKVRIFSGNLKVEFSKEIAGNFFENIKNEPQIQKQLTNHPSLYVPMLAIPQYIDTPSPNEQLTTIEITIDPTKTNDDFNVEAQLNNIDSRILLFLPNVSKINIETSNNNVIFSREMAEEVREQDDSHKDTYSIVKLIKTTNKNQVEEVEEYELFKRTLFKQFKEDDEDKDVNLAIAVPDADTIFNSPLYTFFPLLNTESPFNCIMHATYELGDQRNTVLSSNTNKQIAIEQIKFLIDIAIRYYINKKEYVKGLKLLTPSNVSQLPWSFTSGISIFKIEDEYFNLLKDKDILPTVNDTLISVNDSPKVITNQFPQFIKGEGFENVLQELNDSIVDDFLKLLSNSLNINLGIDEQELADKISHISDTWSVQEQVECFDWWSSNYSLHLPKLLKKQDGTWLQKNEECYFLDGDFEDVKIPKWVTFVALDMQYQDCIYQIANKNKKVQDIRSSNQYDKWIISRVISQNNIYPLVNFNYRDRNSIVSAINTCVKTYDQSIEFVKWLWDNYSDNASWESKDKITYKFPTKNGNVKDSSLLYFGEEYGNDLSSKLFNHDYEEFLDIQKFGVSLNDKNAFKNFISKFDVKDYPKIEKQNISNIITDYSDELKKEIMQNWGSSTRFSKFECSLPYISSFEDIISELTTTQIIQWICNDTTLFNHLNNKYYSKDEYTIGYSGNLQNSLHYFMGNINNYLLYILNVYKWVDIDGVKYAPNEIVFDNYTKNNQKFSKLIPVINQEFVENIANQISKHFDQVVQVFELFDFCKNVTDLDSNSFYGLLLKIPDYDKEVSIEMSRHIYRIIERADFNKKYKDSENKTKFFEEGKLLTQNRKYVLAKNVYLPSTLIVKKNEYDILDKGLRTNNEKFIEVFDCKEYKNQSTILKNSIIPNPINDEFQKNFLEFKKYTRPYNSLNKNIENCINDLSITLVANIVLNIDGKEERVEDNYTEIRESQTKWYITLFDNQLDIRKLSVCIENILSNIANVGGFDAGKYGELFRAKDKDERDFLITKDFGSCDFIYEDKMADELKQKFVNSVMQIASSFAIDGYIIDFNNIHSQESLDSIIKILNDFKISSIKELYEKGFDVKLDFTQYYQSKLDNLISKEENNYKNFIFTKAQNDSALQQKFLNDYYNFKSYTLDKKIEDIIDVKSLVVNEFGNWQVANLLNADECYSANYIKLNPDNKFEDEIANNDKVKLMIYFNNIVEFNNWLNDMETKQKQANEATQKDPYEKFRNLIPEIEEITYSNHIVKASDTQKHSSHKRDYAVTEKAETQRSKNQKILGNKGELVVYNLLCNEYGKENVYPQSEAFVTLGIIVAGLAKSEGCDIEYVDKQSGERFYVEVKAGDGNSFYITPSELEFAKKHSEKYQLYIVYDLDTDVPKCIKADNEFWNNERYKKEEVVEKIYVTF